MTTTLVSIALAVFIIFNMAIIPLKKFPWSMSESYYLLEAKKKNAGWAFTVFMVLMAALLMPAWIEVTEAFADWRNNFTFLTFLSAASMIFVGVAPRYKNEESVIHTVAAIICAVTALAWDFIVGWSVFYVPMAAALIPITIASCTETWKASLVYWLEMIAFDSTFAMLLTFSIINH